MQKRKIATALSSVLVTLLLSPIAWGEPASAPATSANGPEVNTKTQDISVRDQISAAGNTLPRQEGIRVSQILDKDVKNPNGEKLGKINELVMDNTGIARYAILTHGGILNIGDKLVAIPWSALHSSTDGKYLILNISKAHLEQAPSFSKDQWPSIADTKWNQNINAFYKTTNAMSKGDFAKLDANADGYITEKEAQGKLKLSAGFTKIDKNKDGKLDVGELSALETSSVAD